MSKTTDVQSTNKVDIGDVMKQYMPMINKTLEKWIPRKWTEEEILHISGMKRYKIDVENLNKTTVDPIWELLDRGGKRWRSVLLLLVAEAFGKSVNDVIDFVCITEVVHNGTLVIDDIEDNSDYRRGKPCLHKITGVDVAVNAGNFMYYLPLRILREHKDKLDPIKVIQLYEVYSQEMINLHVGQALDICWHSNKMNENGRKEPTVENYLHMCANKTGGLARMCAKMSAILSDALPNQVEAIGRFAESLGIAFQIQDDILNIDQAGSLSINKGGVGEDIHEGKRTIMVIHSIENSSPSDAKRLQDILSMKTDDRDIIQEAISLMKKSNSIEFAKVKAKELIVEAWSELNGFLQPSLAKDKLRALVEFMIERDT